MYKDVLTKEYLYDELITKQRPLSDLVTELNISKLTIIKYCKRHNIYSKVRELRALANGITEDLSGKTFGKWVVLHKVKSDQFKKSKWLCECLCGITKQVSAASLIRDLSKSCGKCSVVNFKGYKDISGVYFKGVRQGAIDRGYVFSVSPKDCWEIYLEQDKKCAITGVDVHFERNYDRGSIQTASIDRIDSSVGYIRDNIQIINKRLNRVKSILSTDELLYWSKLVYLNNKDRADAIIEDYFLTKWNEKT